MGIESNEEDRVVAKGSDGKVHDLHKVVQPPPEGGRDKTEWFLSTGEKATTQDGVAFEVPSIGLTLTRIGE